MGRRRPPRADGEAERLRFDRDQVAQLRRLFSFLRTYRRWLVIATVGVTVSALMGLVFPRVMGTLVDTALDETDTSSLDLIALVLLGVFAVQALFNYLRIFALARVGEGVVADLRRAVFDRIVRLPVPFFDGRKTGEITSRLTSDVAVVQATVSSAVAQALFQGISMVGGIVLLLLLSPVLSLAVLTFLPMVIIGGAVFGRRLRRISTEFQDEVAKANAFADESIASIRVVKWFTAEDPASARYARDITSSYAIAIRRARLRAVFIPFVTFVAFGTLALALWVGGRLVLAGDLTAGELVTFLLYTLIVAGAIGAFTGLYSQLQEALGASRRIFELLDEDLEVPEAAHPVHLDGITGSVRFESVHFTYPGRDVEVLTGIDLEVAPGEVVALVGPSGGGKSTMVQLIPRFYDPSSGRVLVDGVDVRDQPLPRLRSAMAAVPQEVQLFSGTIAENLRIARPDANQQQLEEACRAANAHEFISDFPDRYDTIVGERGIRLSGGQRQRVAIARALLADPRILILDEATSSLDAESESAVQSALERLMEGRTTIVIAHRLSTVRAADRLVVLADGEVVETGPHDRLIAADGLYARLYQRQLVTGDDVFLD
jgi:subfamily B ATP-binding cassette protein MsbA